MQTPSHFLATILFADWHKTRNLEPFSKTGLLLGSILPDLPFLVLTVAGEIYYRWFAVLPTDTTVMEYLHFTLFYTDPVWLVGHNFFHSLPVNSILIAVGYWGLRYRWGALLFWLAVSMQFHTLIDIFTHHSDGPLLFFLFSWSYRFASPISYWEPEYYGQVVMIVEYMLDALILFYFGYRWIQRKQSRRTV